MGTIDFKDNRRDPAQGQSFKTDFCEPNLNLLAHAQALEIGVGSKCGGHGVCGADIVRVWVPAEEAAGPAALSAYTEAEIRHLGAEKLAQGYRLACQCYPNKKGLHLKVEARIQTETEITS